MWLAIGSGQIQRSLIVNWYRRCRLRPTLVSGLLISSRGRNFVFKALRFEIGLRSCTTTTTAVTTTTRPRSSLLAKKIWERKRKIWKYDVTDTIRYYFAYVSRRRERNTFANKNNCSPNIFRMYSEIDLCASRSHRGTRSDIHWSLNWSANTRFHPCVYTDTCPVIPVYVSNWVCVYIYIYISKGIWYAGLWIYMRPIRPAYT